MVRESEGIMGTLDRQSWLEIDPNIKTAAVQYSSTTAGNQTTPIVAGVSGKKIRIFALAVSISIGGTNCYIRSGAAGAQITETFFRTITGAQSAAYYQRTAYPGIYLYQTSSAGDALILNCVTAAAVVSVSVVYMLV
jgi:hypothetical protein